MRRRILCGGFFRANMTTPHSRVWKNHDRVMHQFIKKHATNPHVTSPTHREWVSKPAFCYEKFGEKQKRETKPRKEERLSQRHGAKTGMSFKECSPLHAWRYFDYVLHLGKFTLDNPAGVGVWVFITRVYLHDGPRADIGVGASERADGKRDRKTEDGVGIKNTGVW